MIFAKGHGTQNDFVVLPDLDAELTLTGRGWPRCATGAADSAPTACCGSPPRVRRWPAGVLDRVPDGVSADDWYMDYRNADGSIAQMCGNGVRVFAHYLRASGLESRDEFVVGSLAGPRPVILHRVDATNADVSVDMGKANTLGPGEAVVGGRRFAGLAVDVGNPHLACVDAAADGRGACGAGRRRAGELRPRAIPGWGQRRGPHRTGRRRGAHACARAGSGRNALVRHRNRRRRGRRAGRCRRGHRHPDRSGARRRRRRHHHRCHQLPARTVGAGGPRRTQRGMVARTVSVKSGCTTPLSRAPSVIAYDRSRISRSRFGQSRSPARANSPSTTGRRCAASPACPPNSPTSPRSSTASCASSGWCWSACGPTAAPPTPRPASPSWPPWPKPPAREVLEGLIQRRDKPDPSTYIGSGKARRTARGGAGHRRRHRHLRR